MAIVISIGRWGYIGCSFIPGWSFRLALGWIAITILMIDGDILLDAAAHGAEKVKRTQMEREGSTIDTPKEAPRRLPCV